MHIHQSPLFNPPGVSYSELNFDSTNFTKNIDDCRNLGFFKELKGKYIIIKNYNENEFENVSKLRTVYESDKENIIIKSVDNLTSICK